MGVVFVGIDYGTSSSKVVINDQDAPGGAVIFPVLGPDGSVRIPSGIKRAAMSIELGHRASPALAESVYDSVKMRLAVGAGLVADGDAYYPGGVDPSGWTDEELAVVSVAWLQHRAMRERLRSVTPPRYQFLLGIPMSFREVPNVVRTFVNVARAAAEVRKQLPTIGSHLATGGVEHFVVKRAIEAIEKEHRGAVDDEEFESWLRTETAAASTWLIACNPSITRAKRAYVLTDIGAGTINLSALLFRPHHDEGVGTSILAACSGNTAVNAVVVAASRCGHTSIDRANTLDVTLSKSPGLRDQLRRPLHELFGRIQLKTSLAGRPWEQWAHEARIIGIGGGSMIAGGRLLHQFQEGVRYRGVVHRIEPLRQLRPPQLQLPTAFRAEELVNLAVAYGLAHEGGDGVAEWTPDRIAALDGPSTVQSLRCPCGGANESCSRCDGAGYFAAPGTPAAPTVTRTVHRTAERAEERITTDVPPRRISIAADPSPLRRPLIRNPPDFEQNSRRLNAASRTVAEPMKGSERRHFGNNLEIVSQLGDTVRSLSADGVRKPADVALALNRHRLFTAAHEPWTPRLAWLLLDLTFNQSTASQAGPRSASAPTSVTPSSQHSTRGQGVSKNPSSSPSASEPAAAPHAVTTARDDSGALKPAGKAADLASPSNSSGASRPLTQDEVDRWVRSLTNRKT